MYLALLSAVVEIKVITFTSQHHNSHRTATLTYYFELVHSPTKVRGNPPVHFCTLMQVGNSEQVSKLT